MIFYFSGTNNSKHVAQVLAEKNNLSVVSIANEMKQKSNRFSYTLKENEVIGFVFPVYAWAPPEIVIDFIKKSDFKGYKSNYVFSVCTCGEDVGYTMDCISNTLSHKKLLQADIVLKKINKVIGDKQKNIFDVEIGAIPFIRTKIISPLFNKFVINPKKFYAEDTCTSCRLCEKICPTDNISVDDKPKWATTASYV